MNYFVFKRVFSKNFDHLLRISMVDAGDTGCFVKKAIIFRK